MFATSQDVASHLPELISWLGIVLHIQKEQNRE